MLHKIKINPTPLKWVFFSLFVSIFALQSCKKTEQDNTAQPMPISVGNYVYAYTSGVISRTDAIKIRFNAPVAAKDEIGKKIKSGIFSLSPSSSGDAVWEDELTLVFTPEKYFDTGKQYKGKVQLNKLFNNLPEDVRVFEFNFRTKEQFFDVQIQGVEPLSSSDLSQQKLIGYIHFSDAENEDNVKKIIKAKQGRNKLPVSYEMITDKEYKFVIDEVKRGSKASEVMLSWNGDRLDVDTKGKIKFDVPALGHFKVINGQKAMQKGQGIVLTFSDPLQADQDLDGLLEIQGYKGNVSHVIDGNQIKIYPSGRLVGAVNVVANKGIKNMSGTPMAERGVWVFNFNERKPEIKLVGKGVIMPESNGLIFPFEAVNLNAVEVEVFKIFENNLLQFLQTNDMDGSRYLERVGRIVHKEKVPLSALNPKANKSEMTRYALDLKDFVKSEKGAIYQIRIGFFPEDSDYFCGQKTEEDQLTIAEEQDLSVSMMERYYWRMGRYSEREDPCKTAYYNSDRYISRNVFASNIGLVTKKGNDNSLFVAASDLRTTDKITGATIKIYDYQQQLLKSTQTDGDGLAMITTDGNPYFVVVENGEDRGYLRLNDGGSNSLSRFEVGGAAVQDGIKGFIYGERGVWRPGDTLFLNFILEDEEHRIPNNHPVSMEIYNSRGQLQEKIVKTNNVGGIYNFTTITSTNDPTGNWSAKVNVGGAKFTKTLKVETVKPNRLKINVDFGAEELQAEDEEISASIQSNWLHGTPASNLKAKVELQFRGKETKFDKFNDFIFDDPARKYTTEPTVVFDENLDENGEGRFDVALQGQGKAAGKMNMSVKTRVFEKSGDFSSDNYTLTYSPYSSYTGILIPENKYGEKRLDEGKNYKLQVAAVSPEGKALSNRKLNVGVYRVDWSWWWDSDESDFTSYNSATHYGAVSKSSTYTNSKGLAKADVKVERWGRYLVRVCDEESGHCTGDVFYAGYPWNEDGVGKNSAAMLQFTSDRQEYKVGDVVKLNVPASEVSKGLLTIENGTKVLTSKWFELKEGENTLKITAKENWTPNVYAHITLTQPHAQTQNDLPIRMYGVLPLKIVNPKTQLKPEIIMADKLKPEEEFTVEIKEKTGKPMAYTLAVVDEGLLDLTRFVTPDPWNTFYAKEALGVKTWDMYDQVLGGYGGDLERILSIGGGAELKKKKGDDQAQRFKPVVKHLGPFYLKAGKKAKHKITMPNYIGSVRTMVVAANEKGAYGNAEVTTPVKQPLMVLATLPRVLGPGETLKLPVNIFAMEKSVRNVNISLETSDLIEVQGGSQQSLAFAKIGDEMAEFDIKVKENVGVAKVKVVATSGKHRASQEIEIQVRNPNPYVTNVASKVLEKGQSWEGLLTPIGMDGTNEMILEVSNIPPINLGKRLKYLIRYPHGCLEQTTSSVFPQLYVSRLLELNEEQKRNIPQNIDAAIDRFKLFQLSDGGFAYWPGNSDPNSWSTNYAGHFLLEAQKMGYQVPSSMLSSWKKYQKKKAKNWKQKPKQRYYYHSNDLEQAYRLYTLALAGEPEKGAMNRFRNTSGISSQAKWRLAAAYALTGNEKVAKEIIKGLDANIEDYQELSHTFGSSLRDKAMILETMTLLNDKAAGIEVVQDISKNLSTDRWYGTQTTAYALLSVAQFVGDNQTGDKYTYSYTWNGKTTNVGSKLPLVSTNLSVNSSTLHIKNTSEGTIYARFISSGKPLVGKEEAAENKIKLAVTYKDSNGENIDPSSIPQGTDFYAEVLVTNPSSSARRYDEIALTQIFPSGWEITNTRMSAVQKTQGDTPEYRDFRDDRVYSYFDINSGKTHKYIIDLNAAYQGRYYLPATSCQAMYDNTISARNAGQWVEVVQPFNNG